MLISLTILNCILLLITIVLALSIRGNLSANSSKELLSSIQQQQDRLEKRLLDEIREFRREQTATSRQDREELSKTLSLVTKDLGARVTEGLTTTTNTLEKNMVKMQQDNNSKLEEMRKTVDEKLHNTLEKRLGESFKLVSERLEQVHQGLGEMRNLATGVGDLKKVLTNVKTRGNWGEIQLENIIEQLLTIEQYEKNVATKKGSNDRVEFAIKIPSKDDINSTIYLPIDSKFPIEDYQRLLEFEEAGNMEGMKEQLKNLEQRIKLEAKTISQKYIDVPHTTDFGILFLPTESLYAEVLRRPGLAEFIQREYRIVVAGPTTISAILNALQVGFRTLAIEKRSSEVWTTLGMVKTEFGKFGEILEKTRKKLVEATNTIDLAAQKSRTITRKLKSVEELPVEDVDLLEIGLN